MSVYSHKCLPLQKIRRNLIGLERSELFDSQPLHTCISKAQGLLSCSLNFSLWLLKEPFHAYASENESSFPLLEFCGTKIPMMLWPLDPTSGIFRFQHFSCMRIMWNICKLKKSNFQTYHRNFVSVVLWQCPGIFFFNKYSRHFFHMWFTRCPLRSPAKLFP